MNTADTISTRVMETLRLLRRGSHADVNAESLCEILMGPMITTQPSFRRIGTFGSCVVVARAEAGRRARATRLTHPQTLLPPQVPRVFQDGRDRHD